MKCNVLAQMVMGSNLGANKGFFHAKFPLRWASKIISPLKVSERLILSPLMDQYFVCTVAELRRRINIKLKGWLTDDQMPAFVSQKRQRIT